jgi:hypothetical protein
LIQLFNRNQIDDKQWNDLLKKSPQGYLYAYTWYLDIVSPHWKALIIIENSIYQAVMPVPVLKQFGILYVKQPLFCQQLGIFALPNYEIPFTDFIQTLYKHFDYIADYTLNIANLLPYPSPTKQEKIIWQKTHLINLQQTSFQIEKFYNKDRKINLQRAFKAQVSIIESEDIEPLISIFCAETAHKIAGGVHPQAYNLLREIFKTLKIKNIAKLYYTVNHKQEIEAGALFVFANQKIIYLFNAALDKYRKNNGRTLLIHNLLQQYAQTDYQYFDFESPLINNIAEFYSSFGATAHGFMQIHYNNLPFWVEIPKKVRRLVRKIKLPIR